MKKIFALKSLAFAACLIGSADSLLAQAPAYFNYQAVARDAAGVELTNQTIALRIAILQGGTSGTVSYMESHLLVSNDQGLLNLTIGAGVPLSGTLAAINWANGPYFLRVEMDANGGTSYQVMGTSQLLSVPYALYAETAGNGGGTSYTAGTGIDLTGNVVTNTAPDQTVAISSANADLSVSGAYPNFVLTNTAPGITYTAGTGINIAGTSISNSAPDQTVALTSANSNLTISGTYPNFMLTSNDADLSASNEIQTLSLVGNTLSISGGNNVTLPSGGSSQWTNGTSGAIYYTGGNVGIGTSSPTMRFQLEATPTLVPGQTTEYAAGYAKTLAASPGASNALFIENTLATANTNRGLYARALNSTGANRGVQGYAEGASATNMGVAGFAIVTAPNNYGAFGSAIGGTSNTIGMRGTASGRNAAAYQYGLYGNTDSIGYINRGVAGFASSRALYNQGVLGVCNGVGDGSVGTQNVGVQGYAINNPTLNIGVIAEASGTVAGENYGIYAYAANGGTNYAGYFDGNLNVVGTLSKSAGTFRIDHPLDPANKYLIHSFVESPDMMNIYNGNATTDANGFAIVELPAYFEAANKDFRYQLTVMGQFAQAIVAQKIQGNQFKIQTDKPNVEVSWQITGIRKDAYAEQFRIQPEVQKTGAEAGKYLYPELFGQPTEMGINHSKRQTSKEAVKQGDMPTEKTNAEVNSQNIGIRKSSK